MPIAIKTDEEIEILKEGGRRLGAILSTLSEQVTPGLRLEELNAMAAELAARGGDEAAFYNYTPEGVSRPYPAHICISINEEIVHGIPTEGDKKIKDGDLVTLDMGLVHKGLITDSALTIGVGEITKEAEKLVQAGEEALVAGIKEARVGNHVGDIGAAIEAVAHSYNVSIFRELVGHGVGYSVHEEPYVPNYGRPGKGAELLPGMVIAIEPMFGLGTDKIKLLKDAYTYVTADGSLSTHTEHSIVITEDEPIILTLRS